MCFLSTKNNKKNKMIKEFFFKIIEDNILTNLILQDFKDKKTSKMLNTLSKPFNLILSSFDNIAKLYQLSLNDNLDQDENLSYIINKIQNIFDNGKSTTIIKLMAFFYMSIYNRESMTILYTLLHIIFTDNKEEEDKIKALNCIKFDNNENEINDLKEINLSLRNETVSQEIKLSEVRDFIKKHRRTIDDYYIYDPADSQELKELSDVIY
jgi:succinate dehydrogenase flavin-adding protein (antitoxin of CptAB toxin-antitoxin module)